MEANTKTHLVLFVSVYFLIISGFCMQIEVNDVSKEMDLDIIKQNSQVCFPAFHDFHHFGHPFSCLYDIFLIGFYLVFQVERIIADRISKDNSGNVIPEYLVKWQGLSYAEATWYTIPKI